MNPQTNIIINKKNNIKERKKTPEMMNTDKNHIKPEENNQKKQINNTKEIKQNKAYNHCNMCKNDIKPNFENPYCKKCFKQKLIYKYYLSFQNNQDPNSSIYFHLNNKVVSLEELIKLYNKSYDEPLDYAIILSNVKEKKCLLCSFENNTPLPCGCANCKYCGHLALFFNKTELTTSFICPNKVKYDREQMFKLGKLLFKFKEFNIDSSSVIKYFQIRLLQNCCFCGVKLVNNKFKKKLYDANEDEYANKFLSTISHYFCGECLKRIQNKEFKCKICQVLHKFD